LRSLLSQELAASFNQSNGKIIKKDSLKKSTTTTHNVRFDDLTLKNSSLLVHDQDNNNKRSNISQIQKRKQQFRSCRSQVCEYICKTFLEEDDDDEDVDNNHEDDDGDAEEDNSKSISSHNPSTEKSIHLNSPKSKLRFSDKYEERMNESSETTESTTELKSTSSTQFNDTDVISDTLKLIILNIEHVDHSIVENVGLKTSI
ncbi:hypothetical protein Smp_185750, partial [Schistosoma mansoni]|uniref:hypothetical protein n=1 Tax=Schistosoma mansoni TaxID=6183 RepID=UPI00022C8668